MILIDSSALLAAIDSSQRDHMQASRALEAADPPLLLSPFVLAELDYFLAARIGSHAQIALLQEVADGAYQLESFSADDVGAALEIVLKYKDIGLGLADASIVVLAKRHSTSTLLTLDERHFRTVRTLDRQSFRILPADTDIG